MARPSHESSSASAAPERSRGDTKVSRSTDRATSLANGGRLRFVSISAADISRIATWCDAWNTPDIAGDLRVEFDATPRHVTIYESNRIPASHGDTWIRVEVARLRFTGTTGLWTLYWADQHGKFHLYRHLKAKSTLEPLLEHIASSGDPIFWG